MSRERRGSRRVEVAGVVTGLVLGLLLTVPLPGGSIVDCGPAGGPDCGSFQQSLLFKTSVPYPVFIPVVGALVGAAVGFALAWSVRRLLARRALG